MSQLKGRVNLNYKSYQQFVYICTLRKKGNRKQTFYVENIEHFCYNFPLDSFTTSKLILVRNMKFRLFSSFIP